MANNAKYDDEYVTLGQLNDTVNSLSVDVNGNISKVSTEINNVNTKLISKSNTYTTQPTTPYTFGDTYITDGKIYTCIAGRQLGSFNWSDWKETTTVDNIIATINASNGGLQGGKIANETINASQLAQNSVDTRQICPGVVLDGLTVNTPSGYGCTINNGNLNNGNLNNGTVYNCLVNNCTTSDAFKISTSENKLFGIQNLYSSGTTGMIIQGNGVDILSGYGISLITGDAAYNSNRHTNWKDITLMTKGGDIFLDATHMGDYTSKNVYVRGGNYGLKLVNGGNTGPSSKCLKKNISEFTEDEFNNALTLLDAINIYDYEYKYKIHDKDKQYGFIIDELEDNELADKFLHFIDRKAGILEDNTLDYSNHTDEAISFKEYDETMLSKYMLVCLKALQMKVEELEKEVKQLKEEKKDV